MLNARAAALCVSLKAALLGERYNEAALLVRNATGDVGFEPEDLAAVHALTLPHQTKADLAEAFRALKERVRSRKGTK